MTNSPMDGLETRTGLPDSLRVLADQYPRDLWQSHQNFDGLVRFWLERHLMFRKMLKMMRDDIQHGLDHADEPSKINHRLARIGNSFVQNLHGHHHMEDHVYFPKFSSVEPSIARGFELLDADHHALDERLSGFVENANAVFQAEIATEWRNAAGQLETLLGQFDLFLDRHLTDEEELIVPIILKHGPERFEG